MNLNNKYKSDLSITILLLISMAASFEATSTGVLRVRIGRFLNSRNKLADGTCCYPEKSLPACIEPCNTMFRVCANTYINTVPYYLRKRSKDFPITLSSLLANVVREYRRLGTAVRPALHSKYPSLESNTVIILPHSTTKSPKIASKFAKERKEELSEPCNLGELVTDVVAKSSLRGEEGVLEIQLPFYSSWPITFRLTIEAWNHRQGTNKSIGVPAQLISRHVRHHSVKANQEWVPFKYNLDKEKSIHYSLMISCKNNYFGNNCNIRCDDLDGVRNDRINCTSSGEVSCFEGWTGDLCNAAICREGCHADHGYCTQPGECKCALGWRGKNCDECVPLPGCKHGFCSSKSYECICEPGWEGNYCSIPVCREGCHSTRGYCKFPNECRCRIGWGGETCEECKPLPGCVNGFCIKPLECRCKEGWTGLHCDTPTCKDNCSLQHGYCLNPEECRCEVGWWGENCETCFPYPGCKHGSCEAPWECNCEDGWKGILCDERNGTGESFCDKNRGMCLNGGTCVNVQGGRNYTCACPSLFTGEHCDYLVYSRASIFPIFSRGSSGSRTTLSTTTIPTSTSTFNTSTVLEMDSTSKFPETSTKSSNKLSKSISASDSIHTPPTNFSTSKTNLKENKTNVNENISNQQLRKYPNNPAIIFSIDENVSTELKIPESQSSSEINAHTFGSDNKRSKYSSNQSQSKTTSKHSSSLDKERIFSEIFPIRRNGIFLDRIFNESSVKPKTVNSEDSVTLLEFTESVNIDDSPVEDPIINTDANSLQANQIVKNRYLRHHETILSQSSNERSDHQSSFFPPKEIRLVSQEKPPVPSNLRVSPFIFTGYDSLPQESSHNDESFAEFSHLIPQTRINRRTGSLPSRIDFSNNSNLSKYSRQENQELADSNLEKKKKQENQETSITSTTKSYYEEHYNGRVHIGDVTEVDKHAPLEEIVDAFIELKKLTS